MFLLNTILCSQVIQNVREMTKLINWYLIKKPQNYFCLIAHNFPDEFLKNHVKYSRAVRNYEIRVSHFWTACNSANWVVHLIKYKDSGKLVKDKRFIKLISLENHCINQCRVVKWQSNLSGVYSMWTLFKSYHSSFCLVTWETLPCGQNSELVKQQQQAYQLFWLFYLL